MLETIKKTMQTLGALAVVYKFTKWDRQLKAFFTTEAFVGFFFGIFLYGVLEVLGCLLGDSWVSCVSLVRSLVPKTCKNSMYFKGFEKTI